MSSTYETSPPVANSRSVGKGQLLRYQGRGDYANSVDVDTGVDNLDAAYTNPWLMGTIVMRYALQTYLFWRRVADLNIAISGTK